MFIYGVSLTVKIIRKMKKFKNTYFLKKNFYAQLKTSENSTSATTTTKKDQ